MMNGSGELRHLMVIFLRWWWLLILATVVAAAAGYVASERQPRIYEAATTVMVGQFIQATEVNRSDIQTIEILAQSYADMAYRQPVLQAVVDSLNLDLPWQVLRGQVRVELVGGTQLLQIRVQARSPEEARLIADEVARQLILLSPTAVQNREKEESQRFMRQRLEDLQAKIEAGQARLHELEEAMAESLSAQQVKETQTEINTLEGLIAGWENNYTQLFIFVEGEKSPNHLTVIEPAQASSAPVQHRTPINDTVLAGAVGLVLALGLVFLLEFLDDTIKSKEELSQKLGLTALGTVNRIAGKQYQGKLLDTHDSFSPVTEAYRVIRSSLEFITADQAVKSIVVTSPGFGEGKSVTVANLGIIMAQADLKTVIIDANLRQPVQHHLFQVPNRGGLSDLLRSAQLDLGDCLRRSKIDNLYVLTGGGVPFNPAELLRSKRFQQLLTSLKAAADVIIIDSPPILTATDAAILSNRTDGVVLVIEAGQTRAEDARQAMLTINQAEARILGAILNRAPQKFRRYYAAPDPIFVPDGSARLKPKRRWQWLPFLR